METTAQPATAKVGVAIVHPLDLGGTARRWWLLARLSGLVSSLAMVAAVGWIAASAPVEMSSWLVLAFVATAMATLWGSGGCDGVEQPGRMIQYGAPLARPSRSERRFQFRGSAAGGL